MVKKVIKIFFMVLLFTIIGAFIGRAIVSTDKSAYDEFTVTDTSRAAYTDGELEVGQLGLKDKISASGYFCAYSLYEIDETGEVQVTVRYNRSALTYTNTESEDSIGFRLHISQSEAEGTGKYYDPVSVETTKRWWGLYTYRKLIFENVDLTGLTDEDGDEIDMYVVMTSNGKDVDFQYIRYHTQPLDEYRLKSSDIEALS